MGNWDHGPAKQEVHNQAASARRARIGMVFFLVYLAFYAAFVLINAFMPDVMERNVADGLNLAVCYGLALIVAAFVMALAYGWICRDGGKTTHAAEDRR